MMKDLNVNGKINIEVIDDKISVNIEGSAFSLMNMLAKLSEILVKESNLDEDDILFAVNLGLEDDEEKHKKMNNLTDQLSEMLKDALMGSDM